MKRFFAVLLMSMVVSPALDAQGYVKQSSQTAQGGTIKTTPKRSSTRRRTPTRRPGTTRRTARTPPVPKITAPPGEAAWENVSSIIGRFSVLMPVPPTDKTETVESEHGPYTTHLYVARDAIERVFLVGWVDYHPTFNFNRQAEMEANRDNFVKGVNAKLLSSRTTTIDGYRTLEFTAENEEKIFTSRVYMVGRRPYQIVIGLPKGQENAASVDLFLNSFKVSVN